MRSSWLAWAVSVVCLVISASCARLAPDAPNTGHHDAWDAVFRRRHEDLKAPVHNDPMLSLARDITVLEDDIRRTGSITVKAPDVWGDANLMSAIQEFDTTIGDASKSFDETVQAYIARSDTAEVISSTALSQGLAGGSAPPLVTAEAKSDASTMPGLFDVLKAAVAAVPSAAKKPIGVEPTELQRQRATFVQVSQALRRRNMGDDNTRAAGYGLYLFRVPVSILPGRETHEGHSAVVTLRAQLHVNDATLRYTVPKLVIADLVETLTPVILADWGTAASTDKARLMDQLREAIEVIIRAAGSIQAYSTPEKAARLKQLCEQLQESFHTASGSLRSIGDANMAIRRVVENIVSGVPGDQQLTAEQHELLSRAIEAQQASKEITRIVGEMQEKGPEAPAGGGMQDVPVTGPSPKSVFGEKNIADLRDVAEKHFARAKPKSLELRNYLSLYLGQVHSVLAARQLYDLDHGGQLINQLGELVEKAGAPCDGYDNIQTFWRDQVGQWKYTGSDAASRNAPSVSWLIAVQSGILNQNLKRILRELNLRGKLNAPPEVIEGACFHSPAQSQNTGPLWNILVREAFPLHVFALDPQVEEQNVYDAFARRREMQVALAYSVAKGAAFTAQQKLRMSRQLALDMTSIGLNRTAVAFSHGEDTFGWYFYPRVQSPPTESSNIGALLRTIWSTGPTDCYDQKHRKLEPGIRECEVLIAMPSFVTEVSFDVTTNWEALARPGVTKRSYEEMVAQAGRLHRLRMCLQEAGNEQCYRPGDWERLVSRIDQLEHMLGMQTHVVGVPYQYEQTGTDLFDLGKAHLRPVLHDYYGLQVLSSEKDNVAHVFLQGKNFHPTLTYVIVGGTESHTTDGHGDVEIISRELLRVKISNLSSKLSVGNEFEVRVGTPAGVSEPLIIKATPPQPAPGSDFDWKAAPKFSGRLTLQSDGRSRFELTPITPTRPLVIVKQTRLPIPKEVTARVYVGYVIKLKSGNEIKLEVQEVAAQKNKEGDSLTTLTVDPNELLKPLTSQVVATIGGSNFEDEGTVTGTTYLTLDPWPFITLDTPVTVEIKPWPVTTEDKNPDGGPGTLLRLPSINELRNRMEASRMGGPIPENPPITSR